MEPALKLAGVTGQLEVFPDRVVIKREGFRAKMSAGFFKGEKTLYIKQIAGIQVRHGTMMTNGYIQFTVPGGMESRRGLHDAVVDENSVVFGKKNNELANSIKDYIESALARASQQPAASISVADEIIKLKGLVDAGVLTQDEFERKKRQLLA